MSKLTRNLYDINCILNETRGARCIITEEDMRYIEEIRLELTNLAGPDDIDVVNIIKEGLNKKFGCVNIPNNIIETFTPNGIRHVFDERDNINNNTNCSVAGMDEQLIEIIRTTDLLRDMTLRGATETELWKVVNYLDSIIHDNTITLEVGLLLDNLKGKYQSKKYK